MQTLLFFTSAGSSFAAAIGAIVITALQDPIPPSGVWYAAAYGAVVALAALAAVVGIRRVRAARR